MTPRSTKPDQGPPPLDLEALRPADDSPGLSLEKLGAALAGMVDSGDDPYAPVADEDQDSSIARLAELTGDEHGADGCEITPRSIVEALLFVGSPRGEPLTARQMASLMRGVRPSEVDALVRELEAAYERRHCPYTIAAEGAGYRLQLRPVHARLRDRFYTRSREARLSQAAVEVLAIVAYRAPVTAEDVSRLRGTPSGHILTQLVRRRLLRVERGGERPQRVQYFTTPRFLELFSLASLEDLPRSVELDET